MKKLVIALLVLVALVLLLMPGAVGMMAENQFRTVAAQAESENPGFAFTVEEYERGWFSSSARYRIQIDPDLLVPEDDEEQEAMPAPPFFIESNARIFHGPVFLSAIGEPGVSLLPALAHSVDALTVTGPDGDQLSVPGSSHTRLAFFGRHVNRMHIEQMTIPFEESGVDARITWGGLDSKTHFNSAVDELDIQARMGRLEIVGADSRFVLDDIEAEAEQALTDYGFWAGSQRGSAGGFSITGTDQPAMSMGAMNWTANIGVRDGDVFEDGVLEIETVELMGWQGGPITMRASADGLDAESLGRLVDQIKTLAESPPEDPESFPDFMPEMLALLAAGPTVELSELSVGTPDGAVFLSARLAFPESEVEALGSMILGLDGTARIRVPQAIVDRAATLNPQAGAQVQALIGAGLLRQEEGYLLVDAAMKGGLLTVNGQPLPIPLGL